MTIHESDYLFKFFLDLGFPHDKAVEQYLNGGRADAEQALATLSRLVLEPKPRSILEFASGFGRMTRHLAPLLVNDRLIASDIHPEAIDFIQTTMGIEVIQSTVQPHEFNVPVSFDFIFAISFFSHTPVPAFGRWLRCLFDSLKPGGYLVFTVHGDFSIATNRHWIDHLYDKAVGYVYRPESDQRDLSPDNYGSLFASTGFVVRQLEANVVEAEIVSFQSAKWFSLQDEWVIRRPAKQN